MLHTTVCAVPFYRELMPSLVKANGMANGSLKLRCKLLGDPPGRFAQGPAGLALQGGRIWCGALSKHPLPTIVHPPP